jgi:hypothetical protein
VGLHSQDPNQYFKDEDTLRPQANITRPTQVGLYRKILIEEDNSSLRALQIFRRKLIIIISGENFVQILYNKKKIVDRIEKKIKINAFNNIFLLHSSLNI